MNFGLWQVLVRVIPTYSTSQVPYSTSTTFNVYTGLKFEAKNHFYGRGAAEANFSVAFLPLLPRPRHIGILAWHFHYFYHCNAFDHAFWFYRYLDRALSTGHRVIVLHCTTIVQPLAAAAALLTQELLPN